MLADALLGTKKKELTSLRLLGGGGGVTGNRVYE
jgi:hypothetical protein